MEEDLRSEEALVADVHLERLLGHRVDALVLLDPLGGVRVVLGELLGDIGANVGEPAKRSHVNDDGVN